MKEMEDPAERYVWFGFLLLAGDSAFEGKICLTEEMGYTDEQLASMLKCSVDIIISAKEKMIEHSKIKVLNSNIIQILNWEKYQSEYNRQKPYRMKKKGKKRSYRKKLQDGVTICSPSISISSSISFNFSSFKWENIKEGDIKQWQEAFTACDIELELKKMASWFKANPKKKKKNYQRFIHNWLNNTQERGGTKGVKKGKDTDAHNKYMLSLAEESYKDGRLSEKDYLEAKKKYGGENGKI